MDAEVALYWKIMCKHLQAEAQVTPEYLCLICCIFLEFSEKSDH
jgi:hypothetical protein